MSAVICAPHGVPRREHAIRPRTSRFVRGPRCGGAFTCLGPTYLFTWPYGVPLSIGGYPGSSTSHDHRWAARPRIVSDRRSSWSSWGRCGQPGHVWLTICDSTPSGHRNSSRRIKVLRASPSSSVLRAAGAPPSVGGRHDRHAAALGPKRRGPGQAGSLAGAQGKLHWALFRLTTGSRRSQGRWRSKSAIASSWWIRARGGGGRPRDSE
jgi:hypothetical protein